MEDNLLRFGDRQLSETQMKVISFFRKYLCDMRVFIEWNAGFVGKVKKTIRSIPVDQMIASF